MSLLGFKIFVSDMKVGRKTVFKRCQSKQEAEEEGRAILHRATGRDGGPGQIVAAVPLEMREYSVTLKLPFSEQPIEKTFHAYFEGHLNIKVIAHAKAKFGLAPKDVSYTVNSKEEK